MDWWLASFFLGAIFSLFSPVVPDLFVLFLLLLSSILFFYYPFSSKKTNKPLRLSSGLLFGATWMLFNAFNFQQSWQENKIDPVSLASKSQWVQGEVLSLLSPSTVSNEDTKGKSITNKQLRFNLIVTHINSIKLNKPIKIRLSWKNSNLIVQQGQTVNLKVKIKPSHGLANLGGFNYQTWLNSKRILATGYVVNNKSNQIIVSDTTVRQRLFSEYQTKLPDHQLSALLLALGFGSRTELDKELWGVLQTTGTGHLIAISGLHIGLVATGCFFMTMLLIRIFPMHLFSGVNQLQAKNCRYFVIGLSLLTAIAYGYLAGFSLPTVRALVMLSLYWAARLLAIKLTIKRWVLLTLFVITVLEPFSLFTASFWLSFYAVMIIFISLWWFSSSMIAGNKFWLFIKSLLLIQLCLTCMLLPLSAVFFQQISLVALFANIIAVPWMSFICIPLCLLSVLLMPISESFSQDLTLLSIESLQYLWHYLTYLSNQPWAVLTLSSFQVWLIVIMILAGLIILLFKSVFQYILKSISRQVNHYKRVIVVFLLVPILLFTSKNQPIKPEYNWQLIIFDVGQGLSIFIKQHKNAILYDTGASFESGFNMAEAVILPFLQYEGIQNLDKVFISHGDNDHAGGLKLIQQNIEIKQLIYNKENTSLAKHCLQGNVDYWHGLKIEVLWPKKAVSKENDDSCVLLISDGSHHVLLTGDISKKIEQQLLEQYPYLQADVLIVPHHGSKTSSSMKFIAHVNPKIAVVSAGFLNRWKMPVIGVVNRYQKQNIKLFNSAESGQIMLNFSKQGIEQYTYRENLWPFWFANSF